MITRLECENYVGGALDLIEPKRGMRQIEYEVWSARYQAPRKSQNASPLLIPMFTHLQQIQIEGGEVIEEWARQADTKFRRETYVPPTMHKCYAEGQREILGIQREAISRVFSPSFCYAAIYRTVEPPGAYVGGPKTQLIIPIMITNASAYVAPVPDWFQKCQVQLGHAIICQQHRPVWISHGVTYATWAEIISGASAASPSHFLRRSTTTPLHSIQ
ncbi:hypothetical protein BU16DRAFT_577777 [Lophium mytilinum]|uniref:Uncharacterized protein n=1 Tax=Lophium mytilinum TaxID=390894 RepID=A0A6A6RB55_9PEZI|nr:hypothetical protein BU16DRAFT_577777 [Lophium mytilinum]